jgi:hypothetical protein
MVPNSSMLPITGGSNEWTQPAACRPGSEVNRTVVEPRVMVCAVQVRNPVARGKPRHCSLRDA